jgi:hypothetical protein
VTAFFLLSLRMQFRGSVDAAQREVNMTRAELDAALARLGLEVPEKERDEVLAQLPLLDAMRARLRPLGGRDVAAEPAHVVKFPQRGKGG